MDWIQVARKMITYERGQRCLNETLANRIPNELVKYRKTLATAIRELSLQNNVGEIDTCGNVDDCAESTVDNARDAVDPTAPQAP